jgi:hypothetical protein
LLPDRTRHTLPTIVMNKRKAADNSLEELVKSRWRPSPKKQRA